MVWMDSGGIAVCSYPKHMSCDIDIDIYNGVTFESFRFAGSTSRSELLFFAICTSFFKSSTSFSTDAVTLKGS